MKQLLKRALDGIAWRVAQAVNTEVCGELGKALSSTSAKIEKHTSPVVKLAQRVLFQQWQELAITGRPLPSIWDVGFRNLSQFDEDGLLLYLLAITGIKTRRFVDIGCGDAGLNSNVANLLFNWGYFGVGIDGSPEAVERAKKLHAGHPDTWAYPSRFVCGMVKRETINDLLAEAGATGEVDVLSIDIDGNDYWVWDALQVVSPRIVVVETHIEFGLESIVVPYDPAYV